MVKNVIDPITKSYNFDIRYLSEITFYIICKNILGIIFKVDIIKENITI